MSAQHRLDPAGTFRFRLLRLTERLDGYSLWAADTANWLLLPEEYQAVQSARQTNAQLLEALPAAVYTSTQQRSRTAQRVDEVAIPLQRVFAEHFQHSRYTTLPNLFTPEQEVMWVRAATAGEVVLERLFWFYQVVEPWRADSVTTELNGLDIIFADYRHPNLRALDCSFAYALFRIHLSSIEDRLVTLDLDTETTTRVRQITEES